MTYITIAISFLNIFLLSLTLFITYYQTRNSQRIEVLTPIAERILNDIFLKNNKKIGRKLFQKITPKNIPYFSNDLIDFYNDTHINSKSNDLYYYLSDTLTFFIEKIIPYTEKDSFTPKELRELNTLFKNFSYAYYKEQNKYRSQFYLSKFGFIYKQNYKLYKNEFTRKGKYILRIIFFQLILIIIIRLIEMY